MLKTMSGVNTFSSEMIRSIAADLHTGAVSIGWASTRFGLSRQTIYRRLKSEGTTFEVLLDDIRKCLAVEYLENEKTTVSEIAYLLGFSDPSPFSRAFKRWTGHSPSTYRRAHKT